MFDMSLNTGPDNAVGTSDPWQMHILCTKLTRIKTYRMFAVTQHSSLHKSFGSYIIINFVATCPTTHFMIPRVPLKYGCRRAGYNHDTIPSKQITQLAS